jgi:two-component system response regulator GlrR
MAQSTLMTRPHPMRGGKLLLVDDDPGLLRLLAIRLQAEGYEVEAVDSAAGALAALPRFAPDLVITDLRMENMDGIALLKELRLRRPGLRVLLLTAHGTIPDAVEATQSGAFGFLTKPVDKVALLTQVERALEVSDRGISSLGLKRQMVTRNPAMQELLSQVRMIAGTETPVLLTGPSGSGKSLLAQLIHEASDRAMNPFLSINCSAMPEGSLESELFGHAPVGLGHTDANPRPGLFERAKGGTILLDEIGDMPQRIQVKLLRVLQEQRIYPVGGRDAVVVDVRIISATHRDLQQQLMGGRFRDDLYYRLNGVNLRIPPLAARREDIPPLAAHFLNECTTQHEGEKAAEEPSRRHVFAPEALEMLVAADWPGHVRQLRNLVRQCAATATAPVIGAEQLQSVLGQAPGAGMPSFAEARDEFIRNYLTQLLTMTSGNVSQAARLSKRNRTDFYKLLGRHHLNPDQFKDA